MQAGSARADDRPIRTLACMVLALLLPSCTSVQWLDRDGRAQLLGLGSVTTLPTEGGVVTQMSAPGTALRLVPGAWGCSLGYRETTLYQARRDDGSRELLAVGDRAWGVVLDPLNLVIGSERRFLVLTPEDERGVIQEIHYESGQPERAWLRRREVP